jgi:hypothetical protein
MIHQPKPESIIEELHRIRREISDRFGGDISAIAKDAADRLARSGRPIWKPKEDAAAGATAGGEAQQNPGPVHR